MIFLNSNSPAECARILAERIGSFLAQDKKVLWLLSGGSNINISVLTLDILKEHFPLKLKTNLAVSLVDERYGPVGHPDSNWQQLLEADFSLDEIISEPVLTGLSLEETVQNFSENYKRISTWADVVIGQMGIGLDGHTAGILPESPAVTESGIACSYEALKYTRISLTLTTIKSINASYAFLIGSTKKLVIYYLRSRDFPYAEMPAQVLKDIPESYVYSVEATD
jgi:6-phosphogluconolactonase/glucosamine-6-phosphate isomerase/deaminase